MTLRAAENAEITSRVWCTSCDNYERAAGHVDSIQTGPGLSATVQNLSFTWDEVGNLTSRTDARKDRVLRVTERPRHEFCS
jgi:hypothetical protein